MIKRSRCLAKKNGGRIDKVLSKGMVKKLTTYCRFFQTPPTGRVLRESLLCGGFLWYPPCPDLETCQMLKRARTFREPYPQPTLDKPPKSLCKLEEDEYDALRGPEGL